MAVANTKMRIGIDARPLTVPTTGIGRYTSEITRRLADFREHEIFLYAHRPLRPEAVPERCHVRTGGISQPFLGALFSQIFFRRWATVDKIELFWSPRHHLPLNIRIPAVVTIHDLVWRRKPDSMKAMGRVLESLLMPPALRNADKIIAVSESTAGDIREFYPAASRKIRVIPEAPFLTPNGNSHVPTTGQSIILFLGTFEPRKNIAGILNAYKILMQSGVDTHRLILAGRNGWKTDVEKQVKDLGLGRQIEICHPSSDEDVARLYEVCDFLVLPSFYEGFGLPIVEAMSFGRPVITSNLSSMPEVTGQGGLFVDPKSANDIAFAMKRLITDRVLYDDLSCKAKLQSAKFTWDKATEKTIGVFEEAVIRNS